MRAHEPAFYIDEGAEEFVCEEGALVGLLKINTVGGENASQVGLAGVVQEGRACWV